MSAPWARCCAVGACLSVTIRLVEAPGSLVHARVSTAAVRRSSCGGMQAVSTAALARRANAPVRAHVVGTQQRSSLDVRGTAARH